MSERCSYHSRWSSRSQRTAVQDDHIESNAGRHEGYTDYRPDQCVFDSEIEIEDTYTATIKYNKGALLSYSINFSLPYEGYRLAINGTKGELKRWSIMRHHECLSRLPNKRLTFFPLFGSRETIHVVQREGGHGGGDPIVQEDLFLGVDPIRPYQILSGSRDGAYAVATGEALWRSVKERKSIFIEDLLAGKAIANS